MAHNRVAAAITQFAGGSTKYFGTYHAEFLWCRATIDQIGPAKGVISTYNTNTHTTKSYSELHVLR